MEKFVADGVELEYQERGSGEPLICIHGGMIADTFEAVSGKLAGSYRLITYRRRGFYNTPPHENPTFSKDAADIIALLDHLGITSAHVAGHSVGGSTALQLALDASQRVHTLALLEAFTPVGDTPAAASFGSGVTASAELFQSGNHKGALAAILDLVAGSGSVERLDKGLPVGWHQQAIADLPTLYSADLVAFGAWEFGEEQAATITHPALVLGGAESHPAYVEINALLCDWLPNAEPSTLAGTAHIMQVDNPEDTAGALLGFLARHPMF
jgi:pimeloyl-ACP methyl ester carboxylesterase